MRPATSGAALWAANTGPAINLGKGHPSPHLLPLAELSNAFDAAARRPNAHVTMMQYGLNQGNPRLREQIAHWVAAHAQRPTANLSPDQILITTGSGPALALVCQLFSKPGDTVFVDSPGYFLAYYSFKDCNLNVVQVPTDQHGLDVDAVEKRLSSGERPALVYTVPIANNPTGVSMSEPRKQKLVELSRQYGFKIG
ncbi:Pyridoxal phosphate-dependent transferase [Gracilaria domingensis]|nr:Pyridoxal phosphate-dependent transferase [Gracilaria domingensis]